MSTITEAAPESFPVGAANQPLTVTGTGFTAQSKITLDGVQQVTTFVSDTTLTCPLVGSKLKAGRTYVVSVTDAAGDNELLYAGYGAADSSDLIDYASVHSPDGNYTFLHNTAEGWVTTVIGTIGGTIGASPTDVIVEPEPEPEPEPEVDVQHPENYTVTVLQAFIDAHPHLAADLLLHEEARGDQQRVTLVDWLRGFIESHDGTSPP